MFWNQCLTLALTSAITVNVKNLWQERKYPISENRVVTVFFFMLS